MQEYRCSVKGPDGKTRKNRILKAEDETSLMAQVKAEGLYMVAYEKVGERKNLFTGGKLTLSLKDISMMCRQLSSMLTSGVTLVKALNILYLQIEKKNIKEAVRMLYESVQKGEQLSESLRKREDIYPELMINMVEAGESSGQLDSVIQKLADHYEKEVRLKAKIRTALTYPIILVILSVTVIIVLVTQVLPTFVSMFSASNVKLPLPTQIIISVSNTLTSKWHIILLLLAIIVLGTRIFIGTESGKRKWHKLLLMLPIVGTTIIKLSAVRFTRTLSTLLSSGMSMLNSLDISVRIVGNRVVMDALSICKEDIRKGVPLSQSLRRSNALPPMVYSMVGIGEESGSIEKMLEKCAEYYDDEVDNSITKLVSMIEPLLIIVMAAVIGFIVLAMLLPIFDIYGTIS